MSLSPGVKKMGRNGREVSSITRLTYSLSYKRKTKKKKKTRGGVAVFKDGPTHTVVTQHISRQWDRGFGALRGCWSVL